MLLRSVLNSVKERGSNGALRSQLSPVRQGTNPPWWVAPQLYRRRNTQPSTPSDFDVISRYLSIQCLLPLVRRKRSAALRLVFHLLGGIETRRHTTVTSPDWTGTTLAGREGIVMPGSVGIPREYAKISSFGVDPAGTIRLSSTPESDGAQYHRVHSRVCSL
jgi:hypothetical protein